MADDLQRVGLVFKADGAVDFKKTLRQVTDELSSNRNEFDRAKISWDESTSSMEKLQDRQKYLSKQTQLYSDKVNILQRELAEMEKSEKSSSQEISKKKQQIEKTKTTLAKYEKGLKDVNKEIKSGTAVMKDEMSALDDEIGSLSASARESETAFEKLKSSWDEGTKTAEKLKSEESYLSEQTENYKKQAQVLEKQLELLNSAEEKNERAISEKRSELNQVESKLNSYKSKLDEVEKKLETGSYKTDEYKKSLDEFGEKAKSVGDKLGGVSAAAAGIAGAVIATVPATQEYRKIIASLESSSELAGYSAEETRESYEKLYGVLGDDQTAATTTANLQALGLSQKELKEVINGTIGAWAKYGDSIPIDGLAESINETVRAGQVTGTFADVINWGAKENETFGVKLKANTEANKEWNDAVISASTAEDYFNLAMQDAGSQAERMNLVMQLLSDQGLTQAGQKWQENNKELLESNQATADLQEATAELAETIAPMISQITEVLVELLNGFNDLPDSAQKCIMVAVLLVAALSPLFKIIGSLSGGISGFLGVAGKVPGIMSIIGAGAKALWGIMAANPIGAIITIVGLLISAFVTLYKKCDWFRDGVNKVFGAVRDGIKSAIDKIKSIMDFEWKLPKIKLPKFSITGKFSLSPPSVPKLSVKWNADGAILNRPTIFGMAGGALQGGGEAGKEAVLPIEKLKTYIREELKINNQYLADVFKEALSEMKIICENNVQIGDKQIADIVAKAVIKIIDSKQKGNGIAKGVFA